MSEWPFKRNVTTWHKERHTHTHAREGGQKILHDHLEPLYLSHSYETCTVWYYSNCSAVILAATDRSAPAECERGRMIGWLHIQWSGDHHQARGKPQVHDGSPGSHQTVSMAKKKEKGEQKQQEFPFVVMEN